MAERALRTRSAVRKEIRARRQEEDAASHLRHTIEPDSTPNHIVQQKKHQEPEPVAGRAALSQNTATSGSEEASGKEAQFEKSGEAKATCKAHLWFAEEQASADALLNSLLVVSSLLAGCVALMASQRLLKLISVPAGTRRLHR